MALPDFSDVLAEFDNSFLRGPVVLLMRGSGTRTLGAVTPGSWVATTLPGPYIVHESTSPPGDRPLQSDAGGDRVEDGLMLILDSSQPIHTTQVQLLQDADILQWQGSSYRTISGYNDPGEILWSSATAARIQARNLPPDLPAPP